MATEHPMWIMLRDMARSENSTLSHNGHAIRWAADRIDALETEVEKLRQWVNDLEEEKLKERPM